jgi:hypothetical protein
MYKLDTVTDARLCFEVVGSVVQGKRDDKRELDAEE